MGNRVRIWLGRKSGRRLRGVCRECVMNDECEILSVPRVWVVFERLEGAAGGWKGGDCAQLLRGVS